MKLDTTDDVVAYVRNWSMSKIDSVKSIGDKDAIYKEFEEWIELEDATDIEVVSLEPNDAI